VITPVQPWFCNRESFVPPPIEASVYPFARQYDDLALRFVADGL